MKSEMHMTETNISQQKPPTWKALYNFFHTIIEKKIEILPAPAAFITIIHILNICITECFIELRIFI